MQKITEVVPVSIYFLMGRSFLKFLECSIALCTCSSKVRRLLFGIANSLVTNLLTDVIRNVFGLDIQRFLACSNLCGCVGHFA